MSLIAHTKYTQVHWISGRATFDEAFEESETNDLMGESCIRKGPDSFGPGCFQYPITVYAITLYFVNTRISLAKCVQNECNSYIYIELIYFSSSSFLFMSPGYLSLSRYPLLLLFTLRTQLYNRIRFIHIIFAVLERVSNK